MDNICSNCSNPITANFCSNCGQKKYKRIDRKYVLDEVQYTLLHTNKGFLYSVKNLIKNPGKTAKDYIDGNRVNHYKPLLLVFVLSSISTFLAYKGLKMERIMIESMAQQPNSLPLMNNIMPFVSSYTTFLYLLMLPIIALSSKIAFSNWGQNYYEHIVINSYILSLYNIFCIVLLYPILYLFKNDTSTFILISGLSILIIPVVSVWFFREFYKQQDFTSVLGRAVLTLMLNCVIFIGFIIMLTFFYFAYLMIFNPGILDQLKTK
ncbi:DUF3667 domain-containing protein [Pedobacter namyangjuensis]|uniref:DUF3667 domain-containing protein n=1 Tax=Pedobacter namyangjuensis TaxID=600626 RepID=UPI000DE2775F|nr:DUF3667 domain-containing protein [Pedobacter namyangjuensis]